MRLSEAILLGDTLKKCEPKEWLSADGSCGCAFGGALLAVGIGERFLNSSSQQKWLTVHQVWPWLNVNHLTQITNLYYAVAAGTKTIEDVADYVRTAEPAEPIFPSPFEEGYPQSVKEAVEEADFLALRIPENGVHE